MFEKPPQDNIEKGDGNNQEVFSVNDESLEKKTGEFQKKRDEELKKFYKTLEGTAERHKAELHSAALNVLGGIGGIFEKMGK